MLNNKYIHDLAFFGTLAFLLVSCGPQVKVKKPGLLPKEVTVEYKPTSSSLSPKLADLLKKAFSYCDKKESDLMSLFSEGLPIEDLEITIKLKKHITVECDNSRTESYKPESYKNNLINTKIIGADQNSDIKNLKVTSHRSCDVRNLKPSQNNSVATFSNYKKNGSLELSFETESVVKTGIGNIKIYEGINYIELNPQAECLEFEAPTTPSGTHSHRTCKKRKSVGSKVILKLNVTVNKEILPEEKTTVKNCR